MGRVAACIDSRREPALTTQTMALFAARGMGQRAGCIGTFVHCRPGCLAPSQPQPARLQLNSPPAAVHKVHVFQVARHFCRQLLRVLGNLVVQVDGGGVLRQQKIGREGEGEQA